MEGTRRYKWFDFTKLLFLFLLIFTFSPVKSQSYDSLQVSLLTVAPHTKAVWTIFGHTALRVSDPVRNIDYMFNWGTFDSGKPNFIINFVKGKTDYFLGALPFNYAILEYIDDKVTMTEQILNITNNEKEILWKSLQINCLPENVEYRYNFVFDNCTTRPRDIIERICGGTLIYPEQTQPVTFRQLFHKYTKPYPWLEFGIDCVIGSGADSLISYRYELFLPERLMDALDHSVVKLNNGEEHQAVLSSEIILQSPNTHPEHIRFWERPFIVGLFILFIYIILIITTYKKKSPPTLHRVPFTVHRLPFILLFLIAGAGGCIVTILSFFSVHPCVQANWNILWLHPLHFIAFIGFFFRKSYRLIRWYHAANFVLLSCFLLGWYWIPQELNKAFIPFILCIWVVSGLQFIVLKKK